VYSVTGCPLAVAGSSTTPITVIAIQTLRT
jgi:hypothetical protein